MAAKNKNDFIDWVEQQTNVRLKNEKSSLKAKRNILYTSIAKAKQLIVLGLFKKNGINYEAHLGGYYWIYYRS